MCPLDLSSLKWGDDGELSPNDTLNLVERLARAEEMSQGADQSSLSCSSIPRRNDHKSPDLNGLTNQPVIGIQKRLSFRNPQHFA